MALTPILILTAGFGEGHNAAARNLHNALVAAHPDRKVIVSDVFLEAYGPINKFSQRGYVAMINRAPKLWEACFALMHYTRVIEYHICIYGRAGRLLRSLIEENNIGIVVSVYPGCNHLLDYVYRKQLRRPFKTVTIVTDSLTINAVWYRAQSNTLIVANDATADVMHKAGVARDKMRVLGFPVPRVFASLQADRPVPPPDGKWKVLYVINSGRSVAPEIVRRLLALDNISLSVTVGRDEALGHQIEAVAKAAGKSIALYGWTPEIPQLMADHHLLISKAGGATVQETLAAKTPMIITQIVPGQEEGNARLIIESGAGALATTPEAIAHSVSQAFASDGKIWREWQAAATNLSRPQAADDIAAYLDELVS